ncbi:hypothetical protein ACO0SA_002746 [Hanseniaspora valbyensis]
MVLGNFFHNSNNSHSSYHAPNSVSPSNKSHSANLGIHIENNNNIDENVQKKLQRKETKMHQLLTDYLLEKGILLPKNIDGKKNSINGISDPNLPVEILLASQNENIFLNAVEEDRNSTQQDDNVFDNDDVDDPNSAFKNNAAGSDDFHTTHKFAIIVKLNDRVPIKLINLKILGDVLMYWYANDSKEFYKIANKDWKLNLDKCNTFIDSETMLIDENVQDMSSSPENEQGFEYKNFTEEEILNTEYLPLGTSRKQLFVNEIMKNNAISKKKGETQFAKFYDPGYYIFFMPISFHNSLPEGVFVPSARVKYLLQVSVMVSKTLWKKQQQQQQKKNQNFDALSSTSGSDSESVLSSSEHNSANRSHSFINRLSSSILSGGGNDHGEGALSPTNHSLHSNVQTANLAMQRNGNQYNSNNIYQQQQQQPNPIFDSYGIIYGESLLNIVRTAPPRELSTANKPIYVNRVWNDSLAYEISLPETYVPLESELPIKMKFTPLDKTLKIKRIRVGIVEKIFIKNKSLTTTFNQMEPLLADVNNPYYEDFINSRKKYRCLSILEVKPNRQTGHASMKEVVITNCSNDNIFQYRSNQIDSIVINSKVKFPKFVPFATSNLTKQQLNQLPPPYGVDKYELINEEVGNRPTNTEDSSVVAEEQIESYIAESNTFREVHKDFIKSTSNIPIQFINIHRRPLRGLYASSTTFNRVQVKHKLELVLRISQQIDPISKKYKHFEVVIDTPIVLLSELCESDSMELPSYNNVMVDEVARTNLDDKVRPPPAFEYVLSVPNSPQPMSPINEMFSGMKLFNGDSNKNFKIPNDYLSSSDDDDENGNTNGFVPIGNISNLDLSNDKNDFLPSYQDTIGLLKGGIDDLSNDL